MGIPAVSEEQAPSGLFPGPGSFLEYDAAGIPWRASTNRGSPYWFQPDGVIVMVTLDGELAGRVTEFDRRAGWVRECSDEGRPLPQRTGRVEVRLVPRPATL